MIKLFIVGIDGKMGRTVCRRVAEQEGFEVAGGFDIIPDMDFKVFTNVDDINVDFDAVVDFSRPESIDTVAAIAEKFMCPAVIATTGHNEQQLTKIRALAKKVPVFLSGNMSVGIHVMRKLVAEAVKNLWGGFDVEIIEKHHNQKTDAPSGTAKMLAETINAAADGKANFLYGRDPQSQKRKRGDVAIHAVRGGTIVGEHEVIFAGADETITVSHTALSRAIFADGAIRAAQFLLGKKPGFYEMKDMIV
ncbi:MAG: 4-hydroxy-tetrahydrodipicolinate reductase [Firmicutes bacterium]|nr:4-hydroxy-tetrahydrodipicolinate reductase [Bacillota bacterium]